LPNQPRVTVVVPTLAGGDLLTECLDALGRQTFRDFEAIVVDNSGADTVSKTNLPGFVRVLASPRNLGYGSAINFACRQSRSELVAALNDDAIAHPGWLAALANAAASQPQAGMWASCVRLSNDEMDSAGMLLYGDGSSKQRGHRRPPREFASAAEVLLPSGSAALYRRAMLDQIGGFDEDFFLYCEDTDLGLRAQWAGWTCQYVPDAVVEHRYSHSTGRVSPLKAYHVERNRLRVAIKTFPVSMLAAAPWHAVSRYGWHLLTLLSGRGPAADFQKGGGSPVLLVWMVARAHAAALWDLRALLAKRRGIRRGAAISASRFVELARRHSLTAREVATL
jgi:GT2 family glycosyltransferase